MPPPRALLFDLDGVLVRSEELWFEVVAASGERFRGRRISREEFAPTFGQGTDADIRGFGLACTHEELDAFYAEEIARHADRVWVDPEAADVLRSLSADGRLLAVATNCAPPVGAALLAAARLRPFFQEVSCAGASVRAKPAPDILLTACRGLGVLPAEAWMVGDSRFDRAAAAAAGVRFVGYRLDGDLRVEALSALPPLARHAAP